MSKENKMTPDELRQWIAIRKKCALFQSKKTYSRKEKHKSRDFRKKNSKNLIYSSIYSKIYIES